MKDAPATFLWECALETLIQQGAQGTWFNAINETDQMNSIATIFKAKSLDSQRRLVALCETHIGWTDLIWRQVATNPEWCPDVAEVRTAYFASSSQILHPPPVAAAAAHPRVAPPLRCACSCGLSCARLLTEFDVPKRADWYQLVG